jgi:hypothetical protein
MNAARGGAKKLLMAEGRYVAFCGRHWAFGGSHHNDREQRFVRVRGHDAVVSILQKFLTIHLGMAPKLLAKFMPF